MASRPKRAAATAIAHPVSDSIDDATSQNKQTNKKPAKAELKKKAAKNSKTVEQKNVAVAADAVTKSKKAPAKKNAKQTETTEPNDNNDEAGKVEEKSKKVPSKKNVKKVDRIEQPVPQAKTKSKSKKPPAMKNAKPIEQPAEAVSSEGNGDAVVESTEKGKKRKLKQDEPKMESKVTKSKQKKADQNSEHDVKNEAGPSGTQKMATRSRSAKNVDVKKVKKVPEPVTKRGAKKNQVTGKAKNGEAVKPASKASNSTKQQKQPISDEVDSVTDSAKGRERKPTKTATSPAKKSKTETAGTSTAVVDKLPKSNGLPAKRVADSTTDEAGTELATKRKKAPKGDSKNDPKVTMMNATTTDYSTMNFDTGKTFTLKIVSWNVAGLRALIRKDGFDYFEHEKPNIICLQEIKCVEDEVPEEAKLKGYHPYWCSTSGGRGGVAILSKVMPYNVENNLGDEEMDEEGRIITADYSKFYLVCVYVPNAGRGLVNLDRRLRWNKMFEEHVAKLKEKKPVIICGDMNVAHEEIDLANPKTNKKNAGFSKEERDGMTDLLYIGFVDTFRELYPDEEKAYTFWTFMGGARAKNVGWRLDYSMVSENLKSKVVDSFMRPQILGSDHCPIVLLLNI